MLQSILPDLYLRGPSENYKNWEAQYLSPATCKACRDTHGKVCAFDTEHKPMHIACRCKTIPMRTKTVGTATDKGFDGADAWLMYRKTLPPYYIKKRGFEKGVGTRKGEFIRGTS